MNGTRASSAELVGRILAGLADGSAVEVALAPPFTLLDAVGAATAKSGLRLAAQSLHPASHGAFTGEVSGPMLADLGVAFVIVGHSERRRLFGESDKDVARKAAAAQGAGLTPIVCVGEEEGERL